LNVPKLLVLRGDSLDREIELTGRTVRIGRSPDNDLILEDAGKSVSRNHAEIRYENGRYVLVDRESQNGVWVSGARSSYVVLEPNVVASIGPYRLRLDSTVTSAVGDGDMTEYGRPARESGATNDSERPPEVSKAGQPPRNPATDQKRRPTSWLAQQPKWMLGAAGAVAVGALAVVIALLVGGPAEPSLSIAQQLDAIEAQIQRGDCAGALNDVTAVLANNPTEPRVVALKSRAETCLPVETPPAPPTEDIAGHLQSAAEMIANGQCLEAVTQHINAVLDLEPTNPEAASLKAKAEACGKASIPPVKPVPTSPPTVPGDPLAKPLAPEDGGLPTFNGETQKDYLARVEAMRARYADATSALAAMDYQKAITLFDAILRDAGPQYLDTGDLLADARSKQKETAQKNLQAAREFEKKGDWDRAIEAFRRARQADSSISVDADINRITALKSGKGRQMCEEANARYAFGRPDALQLYLEAAKLLPPDDPCIKAATEHIPQLRR
jgi:tetratricopeptide (TPR) repeat protein